MLIFIPYSISNRVGRGGGGWGGKEGEEGVGLNCSFELAK